MDVQFQTMIYNVLLTLVTTATPILVGYLVVFIRQNLSAKQLQTAKVLASNGVTYAQQVSTQLGLDNQAKLNSALASAKELASKYNVKLTDDQWKNLIEPAYSELKKGLNELGTPAVSTEPTPIIPAVTPVSDIVTPVAPVEPIIETPLSPTSTPVTSTTVVAPVSPEIVAQVTNLMTQSKVSAQNDAINQVNVAFSDIVKNVTVPVQ